MKTIFKKLKKGFTIVELVIVIAVIAILAAVLIPTLANLVDSANESNDMVLVSNLNKIVAAYDTVGEIETVNDALDGALENGYSVSNLTPTSEGNVIVYDSVSNRFALLTANALTADATDDDVIYKDTSTTKTDWTDYTTWVFVDASATTNGYVTITASGDSYTISGTNSYILTGTDWNDKDVSANNGLVLFDNTKTITLNSVAITESTATKTSATTNSETKTAISKKTTENSASATLVISVKAKSLSYKGTGYAIVSYSTVTQKTSIDAGKGKSFTSYGTSGQYEATSGTIAVKYIDSLTVISLGENASDVSIDLSSLSSEDVKNIYPTEGANKIIEQLSSNPAVPTANVLDNSATVNEDGKVTCTLEDGSTYTFTAENVNSDGVIELGSEAYPYLVSTVDELKEKIISTFDTVYLKLAADIEMTTSVTIMKPTSNIVIDGNGHKIYANNSTASFRIGSQQNYNISIKNMTFENSDITTAGFFRIFLKGTVSITNCTFTGGGSKNYGVHVGADIEYAAEAKIENCEFTSATLKIQNMERATITVKNTDFYMGTIEHGSDSNIYGINASNNNSYLTFKLENVTFKGEIRYGIFCDEYSYIYLNNITFDVTCTETSNESLFENRPLFIKNGGTGEPTITSISGTNTFKYTWYSTNEYSEITGTETKDISSLYIKDEEDE